MTQRSPRLRPGAFLLLRIVRAVQSENVCSKSVQNGVIWGLVPLPLFLAFSLVRGGVGPVGIEPTTRGLKVGMRIKAVQGVRRHLGGLTWDYARF